MVSVLLIEDDDGVRDVVRTMLERMGHDVQVAVDGREGLTWMERERTRTPPELVVTDIVMPGEEGLMVIRRLHELAPQAKILAISGGGARLDAADCLEMATDFGAHRTLRKPFRTRELEAAVSALLGRGS